MARKPGKSEGRGPEGRGRKAARGKTCGPPSSVVRPPSSGRRIWLYRLTAVVLAPLLFLGLLELGLRAVGYGYNPRVTVKCEIDHKPYRGENVKFAWRFFPPILAREFEPFAFPVQKPADTCRIFVLGSSAAQGIPNHAFCFGRFLRVMLEGRFPGVHFEVITMAMAAINSHVVVEIAKECARYVRARDLDTLRFRADTRINKVVREVATQTKLPRVHRADVAEVLNANSPHGLPGDEFFYEHVHLTFEGNYTVAKTVLGQIEPIIAGRTWPRIAAARPSGLSRTAFPLMWISPICSVARDSFRKRHRYAGRVLPSCRIAPGCTETLLHCWTRWESGRKRPTRFAVPSSSIPIPLSSEKQPRGYLARARRAEALKDSVDEWCQAGAADQHEQAQE